MLKRGLALLLILAAIGGAQVGAAISATQATPPSVATERLTQATDDAITAFNFLHDDAIERIEAAVLLDAAWQSGRQSAAVLNIPRLLSDNPHETIRSDLEALLRNARRPSRVQEIFDAYVTGMAASMDDAHTSYVAPAFWEAQINSSKTPYFGFASVPFGEHQRVWAVREDSPALEAGLEVGDVILSTAPRESAEDPLELSIRRGSRTAFITIEPAFSPEPAESRIEPDFTYLRIFSFHTTGAEFQLALNDWLPSGENLVIDLRSNSGGSIGNLAYAFGRIRYPGRPVTFVRRDGSMSPLTIPAPRNVTSERPARIVVLVNEGTASAAELFAAGLQSGMDAIVLGKTTRGVTHAARLVPVGAGGLRLAVNMSLVGPHQVDIEGVGVIPDEEIEPDFERLMRGEDNVLERAKELLRAR